jgi:aminoglycoside phosphotransferase (APT) family kinase protein
MTPDTRHARAPGTTRDQGGCRHDRDARVRVGWNSDIMAVLRRAGLLELGAPPAMQPLAGGVSSDIWRVDIGGKRYCVKRALARLKVSADWRAPIERNNYEAAYLAVVDRLVPGAVPRLIHADRSASALVTRYLDPASYRLWKADLMIGRVDQGVARAVGDRLGRIHQKTAGDPAIAAQFKSDAIFHAIRLEPYLLATAEAQPMVATSLRGLARRTAATRRVLVHGDVSPKNILVGALGPILLDAECAWYGDPAFDLAFVLNHLCLKAIHRPADAQIFGDAFTALALAYLGHVDWEAKAELEGRAASLLPGLMLARIDGKSPVEYLTTGKEKADVRAFAIHHLTQPLARLEALREAWFGGLA